MGRSVSNSQLPRSRNFGLIKDSMLQSSELPLADVLDGDQWQETFEAHEIDFGNDEDSIALGIDLSSVFQRRDAQLQSCCWPRGKTVCGSTATN